MRPAQPPVGEPDIPDITLHDGTVVAVRAIQPDDVERLERLFFRLSPRTVYLRFFQPVHAPSMALSAPGRL